MLTDVVFPVFAPSNEWSEACERFDYEMDRVEKEFGSPFASSQSPDLKVRDGIYLTDLNPEHQFREAGLDIFRSYGAVYDAARTVWDYREENGLPFISLFEIAAMYKLAWYGDIHHSEYGLCDNADQILKKWGHLEAGKQRHFITMTPIYREFEPSSGGFRFHKWGEYIGEHELEYEYLVDQTDIDVIYSFHIHTLKPESGLGSIPAETKKQTGVV